MLGRDLEAARLAAIACSPVLTNVHCTGKLQDRCGCDFIVEDPNGTAAQAFHNALSAFNAAQCPLLCPAVACLQLTPPGVCTPVVGGAADVGTCLP